MNNAVQTFSLLEITRSLNIDMSVRKIHRIFHNILHSSQYKITHVHVILPGELQVGHKFVHYFLLSRKRTMIGTVDMKYFLGTRSPFLFPKLYQYTNLQNKDHEKFIFTCISTTLFCKWGNIRCGVHLRHRLL